MFNWIYDFPPWFGTILLGLLFAAFNTMGVHYIRPAIRPLVSELSDENTIISNAMSVYSIMFGLLLGMLAVITYQNLTDAQSVVDNEANAVATLYQNVASYPEAERAVMLGALKGYTVTVIEKDWPEQQAGRVPDSSVKSLDEFRKALFAFTPKTEGEIILQAETVRQFNNLASLHRARLNKILSSMPAVLWQVLVSGVFICIMMMWLFDASAQAMLLLSGISSFALGAVIGLIVLLDNPFLGDLSVSPASYELVLRQLMGGR
jgi:hypothetical protein